MIYYDQNKDDNKMLAHLSRMDSETGYDDYDPRDASEPEDNPKVPDGAILNSDFTEDKSDDVELDRR